MSPENRNELILDVTAGPILLADPRNMGRR